MIITTMIKYYFDQDYDGMPENSTDYEKYHSYIDDYATTSKPQNLKQLQWSQPRTDFLDILRLLKVRIYAFSSSAICLTARKKFFPCLSRKKYSQTMCAYEFPNLGSGI